MKHAEKLTSVAAALGAAGTLVCCLPASFAAAAATASLSGVVSAYQGWFLGASMLLLAIGGAQVVRVRRTCPTRSGSSIVIFTMSALVVALVVLFPQLMAALLADLLP